jgi:hypothetical protein
MNKHNEFYEKPSKGKQWQERSERPIAARYMTKADMDEFRYCQAQSFNCDVADITYKFQKIRDDNDDDRDDCLLLAYFLKCFDEENKSYDRQIFSLKIPLPDHIKTRAENTKRTPTRRKKVAALPAPIVEDVTEQAEPKIEPKVELVATVKPRPVLKKPQRK